MDSFYVLSCLWHPLIGFNVSPCPWLPLNSFYGISCAWLPVKHYYAIYMSLVSCGHLLCNHMSDFFWKAFMENYVPNLLLKALTWIHVLDFLWNGFRNYVPIASLKAWQYQVYMILSATGKSYLSVRGNEWCYSVLYAFNNMSFTILRLWPPLKSFYINQCPLLPLKNVLISSTFLYFLSPYRRFNCQILLLK